jgi:hypothetical protein
MVTLHRVLFGVHSKLPLPSFEGDGEVLLPLFLEQAWLGWSEVHDARYVSIDISGATVGWSNGFTFAVYPFFCEQRRHLVFDALVKPNADDIVALLPIRYPPSVGVKNRTGSVVLAGHGDPRLHSYQISGELRQGRQVVPDEQSYR